jgi:hypothetical protein
MHTLSQLTLPDAGRRSSCRMAGSIAYIGIVRCPVRTPCVDGTDMVRDLAASITKQCRLFRGKGGLTYRTHHCLAATRSAGTTSGWFMVAKGEVLRVHGGFSVQGAVERSSG